MSIETEDGATAPVNPLAFMGDTAAPAPEPTAEVVPEPVAAEPAATSAEGPARGPDGKFVAKDAAPAKTPAQAAPVTAPAAPAQAAEPGFVPITALMDVRDRAQKAEAELAELRAKQTPAQPQGEPVNFASLFADDAGLAQWNIRADVSEDMVRQQHGNDLVNAAQQWGIGKVSTDAAFAQQLARARSPYKFVIEQYQRDQALTKFDPAMLANLDPAEFAAFQTWKASQTGDTAPIAAAAPAAVSRIPPPTPPRTLASQPSAGGAQHVPNGPGQAYDATFAR